MTPDAKEAIDLAEKIAALIRGRPPNVQGAALAQNLAAWLHSHPEVLEKQLLDMHVEAVRIMARTLRSK